jgi:hypothetical protein
MGKIEKMGTFRPLIEREVWGRGPPAYPAGERLEKYFQAPPEGFFANKKSFLFVKRSLRLGGRYSVRPVGGRWSCLFFVGIYVSQTI